jgi:hypothetical protein
VKLCENGPVTYAKPGYDAVSRPGNPKFASSDSAVAAQVEAPGAANTSSSQPSPYGSVPVFPLAVIVAAELPEPSV